MKRLLKKRGFTLIELMIVVAILGILAAVAIPAFINYMKRAKTSEATINVDRMYEGAVAYYEQKHVFKRGVAATSDTNCMPSNAVKPAKVPKGVEEKGDPTAWYKIATWKALDFAMSDNHLYQYEFGASSNACGVTTATFSAGAHGDINGNDVTSDFYRDAAIVGGEIHGSSGIYKNNPLE